MGCLVRRRAIALDGTGPYALSLSVVPPAN